MSDIAIDTHALRKEFGSTVAVADLTLQVNRGEVFGFLGPNGAGKTTSVKMLMGLISATSGAATLLDRPLGDLRARERIGFLPEHFRFHEWLRAAEFLELHGRLFGMSRSEAVEVIPDLLELVGLGKRANTKLSAFSKGMLQRIGLAQALINEPDLVFLDEPTSGLDPLGRRLVRDIIGDLKSEGITVFLNSHLLSEIELTCDRVAFIRHGEILRVASLAELEQEAVEITIRVGQPTAELISNLAQFGDGARLDESSGRIHMTVSSEDEIPEIVSWLVEGGNNIYELSPQRLSLEERFLQIIGDEMFEA